MEIPFDPDSAEFPSRKDLPSIEGAPKEAAWVWGANDHIGRLNLLTPARVKAAAAEIKTGEMVSLNLPLNVPEWPAFGREKFKHSIKTLRPDLGYDDLYELNTQSGTQWDGFRHVAHRPSAAFYNNIKGSDITGPNANLRCGIHYWVEHGIAGRGILLDYRSYAHANSIAYDPDNFYAISWQSLYDCGQAQGIDIRPLCQGGDVKPGDILLVRSGFVESYNSKTSEQRKATALRPHAPGPANGQRYAGVKQEEAVLDWLHDCYFAAVAGDAPAFEAWPSQESYMLHEYILALWGMPLGEMLDLEALAKKCHERGRWIFFLCSVPANVPGGVGSHVNGTAIF